MRTIIFILLFITGTFQFARAQVVISGANPLTPNGNYLNLALAFIAIELKPQTGYNISITITANTTETISTFLRHSNQWASLSITPVGHVTVLGNNVFGPLLNFIAVDNVTINGINNSSNSLTLQSNTVGTGHSTIRFSTDATNHTITNCIIRGSSTGNPHNNLLSSVIFISGTSGTSPTGNDNITISNNDIGAGTSLPYCLIKGYGNILAPNSNIIISGNKLHDFFSGTNDFSRGIYVGPGCSDWTITNNKIYQSATRQWTGAGLNVYSCIEIKNLSGTAGNNFTVSNNILGYQDSLGNGNTVLTHGGTVATNWASRVHPLIFDIPGSTGNTISGNTINGIDMTSSNASTVEGENIFAGIFIKSGTVNVNQNRVGSLVSANSIRIRYSAVSSANTIPATAIYLSGNGIVKATDNQIGGISLSFETPGATNCDRLGFIGIYSLNSNISEIRNNKIGGAIASSIKNSLSTGPNAFGFLCGIYCKGGISGGKSKITGNRIRNFDYAGTYVNGTSYNANIYGIYLLNGVAGDSICRDTITDLYSTIPSGSFPNSYNASVGIVGNSCDAITGIVVNKNIIHSFSARQNTFGHFVGISASGGKYIFSNNMISLGNDSVGMQSVVGIEQWSAAQVTACFNTVRISGNNPFVNSLYPPAAYLLNNGGQILNLFNNILVNEKVISGEAPGLITYNPGSSTYTGHHNIIYGEPFPFKSSTNYDQVGWFAATGQEPFISSKVGKVNFYSGTDLHTNDTIVRNGAISVAGIPDDIDGFTRGCPDIGCDEYDPAAIPGTDFVWVGGVSDSWCSSCNWDRESVPPAGSNVIIADECCQYPYLKVGCGNQQVNNFTMLANTVSSSRSSKIDLGQFKLSVSGNINTAGKCSCTGVNDASNINAGLIDVISVTNQQLISFRDSTANFPGEICKLRINKIAPGMTASIAHEAILKGNLKINHQFDISNGVLLSQSSNTYDADENTAANFKTITVLNDDPSAVSRQLIPSQNTQNGFFMGRLNRKIRQGSNGDEYLFPLGFRRLSGPGNILGCFYTPALVKFTSVTNTNYLTGTYLNTNNNFVADGVNLGPAGNVCGSADEIDDFGGNTAVICSNKEIDELALNYWDFMESSGITANGDPVAAPGSLGNVLFDIQTAGDVYNLTTSDGLIGSSLRLLNRTNVTIPANTSQGPWNTSTGIHSDIDISTNPGINFYTLASLESARRNNVTIFGGFAAAGNGLSALPVELLSFDANKVDDENLTVCKWTTASEFNSAYFIVEAAPAMSKMKQLEFQAIGTVPAAGSSNELRNYTFIDTKLHSGWTYFRLVQVDIDDNRTHSGIVSLFYDTDGELLQFMLPAPNPVTSETNIIINARSNTSVLIKLIDKTGKPVFTFIRELLKGENEISLGQLTEYAGGVYTLEVTSENTNKVFKLMIAH